jgi:23S rRNA pseudouridine2604 synthase
MINYPIRINKYLADKNICSRREADELIKLGKVRINGKKAVLGDKVLGADEVIVSKKNSKKLVYYAYNKPIGIVTHGPQGDEKAILDISKFPEKVYPIGRLDKDSWGLIILTNDGRITDKVLNPEKNHEKEYFVKVNKIMSESFLNKMGKGVMLEDGYKTKPAKVQVINEAMFSITLTEGKKRQIRRMCAALGYSVIDLKRVRVMNIKIGGLKPEEFREIKGAELKDFFASLDLN